MTPEELAYHLRECEAPPGFCPVCDIVKAARIQALEEAAKFVEENYEEPFTNIVGNQSWRERGPKRLAAAIRALKDKS